MSFDANDFIRTQTILAPAPLVPEITLHLAAEVTPLWHATEASLKGNGLPPPYWAFAWPGGQGIARYILDHPDIVRGKRMIDFAAGCGIGAIAAMKAGAKKATAVDIDSIALAAIQLNAAMNHVTVQSEGELDMEKPIKNVDLILVGDACYQQGMSAKMMRWLWLCFAKDVRVFIADPGRAYVPQEGLKERARYEVPTSRDLEDRESRTVIVWELVGGVS